MTDRGLLELVAAQVGALTTKTDNLTTQVGNLTNDVRGLQTDMQGVKGEIKGLKGEMQDLKIEVADIKKRVIHIENDHGAKLDALFDGYKQNDEKLTRIEAEVSKHDEFIMRRIK